MIEKRGIAIWVVLSVAVVMGVLLFSFNLVVRQRNAQAHALYFGEVAEGLAESGLDLSWVRLRRQLRDESSSLHQEVVQKSCEELLGSSFELSLHEDAKEILLADGSSAIEVEASVVDAKLLYELSEDAFCKDPMEKRIVLSIKSVGEYRGLSRTVSEQREVLVQSSLLPLISKFSLFVGKAESQNTISPGYNRYANDINGSPDTVNAPSDENYLPLVLFNHGETLAKLDYDLDKNGWVYLGASAPVVLNLTSGADYQYGQYFHFYNFLEAENSKQAAFINDSPPPFFQTSHPYDGRDYDFFLKHVIYGYFTIDAGSPPGSMNKNSLLDRYFSDGTTMRSSCLHLFGTALCPSPTRVFGEVYQSYPIYSGITVDIDGDGKRDGLLKLLRAIGYGEFANLDLDDPIPTAISNLANPSESIPIDTGQVTYANMFSDENTYAAYMSTLIDSEPYNRSIDYMTAEGEFPPSEHALDADSDYPNLGEDLDLEIETDGSTSTYFSGSLADLSSQGFRHRSFLEYASTEAFLAEVLDGKDLHLCDCQVIVDVDELELPSQLSVKSGGVIMCRGDIVFNGVKCSDGEKLSLVSLEGDIRSPFDHCSESKPDEVSLIALDGKVRSTENLHPICLRGTLAAKKFAPHDFRAGGLLVYPLDNDPTSTERAKSMAVHVSDRPLVWSF